MSDYETVKCSKLVLKGEKRKKSKHSKKEKKAKVEDNKTSEDALRNGEYHGPTGFEIRKSGWWCLDNFASLTGQVCIEIQPQCYVRARDNGTFIVGQPHNVGEGPDQEEILTCIRVGDSQIALKSGYNKYLAITASDSKLIGVSDAVGQREMFEPIFQDGKLAISACNGCFLAPDDEEGHHLYAKSKKATDAEFVKIRSNVDPERIKRDKERSAVPSEERGSLLDCEQKYMKKFQSHADGNGGKLLAGGAGQLKKAKDAGSLHEVLLDRRAKIKSDKFCK